MEIDTNVGIVGFGCVGSATGYSLGVNGHDVCFYDEYKGDEEVKIKTNWGGSVVMEQKELGNLCEWSDVIISCVPTPTDPEEGEFDGSIAKETANKVFDLSGADTLFVQRSTCLPEFLREEIAGGSSSDRDVIFVPSYLYRSRRLECEVDPPKLTVGLEENNQEVKEKVREIWHWLDKEIIYFGTLEDAAMAKYASNNWQVVIMSMWNELFRVSEEIGNVDPDFVAETVVEESNLSSLWRAFGKAFGQDGRMQDDSQSLVDASEKTPLQEAALRVNELMMDEYGEETRSTEELKEMRDHRNESEEL